MLGMRLRVLDLGFAVSQVGGTLVPVRIRGVT